MSNLSQDPLTKHLVKFCKNAEYHLHKHLAFKNILSIISLVEEFKKYSIQAYISEKPIQNPVIHTLSISFNWILSEIPENKRLTALFYFLTHVTQYIQMDLDFRSASEYYGKDFLVTFLKNDVLKPIIVNKDYTTLIIKALYIDFEIQNDQDIQIPSIDNFFTNLSQTFYEIRKEIYKTFAQRIQPYKEELIANVMHPSRIQKMLDSGLDLDQIMEIY
jgi:hypothetical protein